MPSAAELRARDAILAALGDPERERDVHAQLMIDSQLAEVTTEKVEAPAPAEKDLKAIESHRAQALKLIEQRTLRWLADIDKAGRDALEQIARETEQVSKALAAEAPTQDG